MYLFGGGAGTRCARATDGLMCEPGSTLALNGGHVYVYEASSGNFIPLHSLPDGTIKFGCKIELLPEPGALVSLLAGVAMLGALRRRRRATK